ncbi:151_t:CDS:2 [Ambispora gerdemannii]|uniref:RING-type E3 ubiquitin transferase n=1 Tax=Ambispora gerdemannii TaxID=144530 RepID=A0A9N9GS87_9GLOM|nr:151_t:CDS:2 [Ambispora gerdemannii]
MNESWHIPETLDFDCLQEISQDTSAEINSDTNNNVSIKKEKRNNNETIENVEQTLTKTLEVESEPRPSTKYSLKQRHTEDVSNLKSSLDNDKNNGCSSTSGISKKGFSVTNNIKENTFASETSPSSSIGEGSSSQKDPCGPRINNDDNIYSNIKHSNATTSNVSSEYECNICFDTASSPVLTLCGHLFCWPCLHQWLEVQSQNPLCPVCKAGCGKDKVIPIYGRGKEAKDPRMHSSIPNRPAGQRPQPRRDPSSTGSPFFPGSHSTTAFNPHFSVTGVSLFPSFFGPEFTFLPASAPGLATPVDNSPQQTGGAYLRWTYISVYLH